MVSSEEDDIKPFGLSSNNIEWDCEKEIQLFCAMAKHKPVGISKHFQMACIWEKFSNNVLCKEITTQHIWDYLKDSYDLSVLELAENEPIPFPNNEVVFILPHSEYGDLLKSKCKENTVADDSEECRSPSPKLSTSRSNSRSTSLKEITPKALRKDSISTPISKTRKESGSSHASTDTPSIKSEKDFDKRRDSRDSNASGPRENSSTPKSLLQRSQTPKSRLSSVTDEEASSRRGRRRANTSTPPTVIPAKRRRT